MISMNIACAQLSFNSRMDDERWEKMKYPLKEKIGKPELLVGREKEFKRFDRWIDNIPEMLSKSRMILARRKSGKTSFVQRIYNRIWHENGPVIPFYFNIENRNIRLKHFAIKYFRTFASQYISFLERDETLVGKPLSLEKIREYGLANSIQPMVNDVDSILNDKKEEWGGDPIWDTARNAPHRYAAVLDIKFLVILDEFQNISHFIYRDEKCEGKPNESLARSYYSLSESKIAPILAAGPYLKWPMKWNGTTVEAGSPFCITPIAPFLTVEEGLQAVYKYSEVYKKSVTKNTAILINHLCMSDPFFISCIFQDTHEGENLTNRNGVIDAVVYETTDPESKMSETWRNDIERTFEKINDKESKRMLLHLIRHSDRYWTPQELKEALRMDLDVEKIKKRLRLMVDADVIEWGNSDIQFRGLQDGTMNLILRNRFEEEISGLPPAFKREFHDRINRFAFPSETTRQTFANTDAGKDLIVCECFIFMLYDFSLRLCLPC